MWIAAERLPELLAVHPTASIEPHVVPPATRAAREWTREEAIVELLRGRLTILGPSTAAELAASMAIPDAGVESALLALESEGAILRGSFTTPRGQRLEWCDRRLLARIHRYTLNRLRAEIEPVSPADFMRFLFSWQHVDASARLTGIDGLRAIAGLLDGYELAANAWEQAVLPARIDRYDSSMLDMLCLTGEVGWARLSRGAESPGATRIVGATPIALFLREHFDAWQALRATCPTCDAPLGDGARRVLEALRARGASFFRELAAACELNGDELRAAVGELVTAGLVSSDGFAGLRALVAAPRDTTPAHKQAGFSGRWAFISSRNSSRDGGLTTDPDSPPDDAIELQARVLLRRYGIVFRRLLARETNAASWRDLARVYRRLEARGEIRGGRFVSGMSGEQFASPDAVERVREVRRAAADGRLTTISAADPLNLAGIVTAGDRVRAAAAGRIVYRDGVPLAALEGEYMRPLAAIAPEAAADVATALAGRRVPPVVSGFIGRAAQSFS